jgi:GMP synthase-like glutamine amidotransferase
MRPLTIFRHIRCEGPGYLADVLDRQAIPYRIIEVDNNEDIPDSIEDSAGLVFMGGPMSVNDPLPWIEQELALIRMAQDQGLPVLGHCLGGQLISRALGGTITANPVKEIGWHPVRKAETAAAADWLRDLLENDNCAHQAFAIGNTLALQCHVEMTASMVREWSELYKDELQQVTTTVQSAAQMTTRLTARILAAQQVADRLYQRWLKAVLNPS